MASTGTALQRARKALGLTQAELGQRAGVARMTVQRLEADDADPRLSTVTDLARSAGLDLMLVPASLRQELEDFVRSGGRYLGREPGIEAPRTATQDIRDEVRARADALPKLPEPRP